MKKVISKTAFSLLELIIASVLVVIVILGIFSINSVLSNNNQDYGQRFFVKSETQATLNHIINNAAEAIGSGTTINGSIDQGILWGATGSLQVGDAYSFCIHQDIPSSATLDSTSVNNPPTTPPSYSYSGTNSRWLCYSWYASPSNSCPGTATFSNCSSYQIWYCSMPYSYTSINEGASSCNGTTNALYLGTAFTNPVTSITFSPTAVFSITLQNCLDNTLAAGACPSTNNPQQTVSGSVFPSQVGLQQN